MLSSADLIHLPYTPDLTEGGIAYALRSLACSDEQTGKLVLEKSRHRVADVALELAFRRHLQQQNVPFRVLGLEPFTHPEHYDISLGGHRCILKSHLISRREQITQIRRHPSNLLQAPALVPLDTFAGEDRKPDDIFVFAFLLGLVTTSQPDLGKAIAAGQPIFLIHTLPQTWGRPREWLPLPKLSLKSECGDPIKVALGGRDAERNFTTAKLELPSLQRVPVEKNFHSLAYIHVQSKPDARIGIHSPLHGEPYLIPAHAWSNLWVYGMDIILTGWLTHEEFRRKARVLIAGAHTLQIDRTRVKNLFIPCIDLNPLGPLFKRVRDWNKVGNP